MSFWLVLKALKKIFGQIHSFEYWIDYLPAEVLESPDGEFVDAGVIGPPFKGNNH